jgi:hypothetical protein
MAFPSCWFDEDKCDDGLQALRHYRYKVSEGQYSNEPVHDWASDGADAFRYMALALRDGKIEDRAVGVMERLRGYAAAALKQREEASELEFSGRPRMGAGGWMR